MCNKPQRTFQFVCGWGTGRYGDDGFSLLLNVGVIFWTYSFNYNQISIIRVRPSLSLRVLILFIKNIKVCYFIYNWSLYFLFLWRCGTSFEFLQYNLLTLDYTIVYQVMYFNFLSVWYSFSTNWPSFALSCKNSLTLLGMELTPPTICKPYLPYM